MASTPARPKGTSSDTDTPKTPDTSATGAEPARGTVLDELKAQHRTVEALLSDPGTDTAGAIEQFMAAWIPHTTIEETIIIPALRDAGADESVLGEAEIRRDLAMLLVASLKRSPPDDPLAMAKLTVLADEIGGLIELEERASTGLLAQADSISVDLEALRPRIDARMAEIQSDAEGESIRALEPYSPRFRGSARQQEEYSAMPSSNNRERDDNGRFRSDDDDRRSGSGSRSGYRDRDDDSRSASDYRSSSRSQRDYDDDRRGSQDRDERGRFASDDRNYSRSSRSDDDDRRSGRDDRGGWFGDPEGHSEAARRGWEGREVSRSSSRSSRDDDDGGRDRDERGRFASDDRRSSRSDDDDRGRDRGGWFGDSRGHSEAARRGWENRDDDRSRSSRDDDDRYRYSSSRDDDRSRYSSRDDDDYRRSGSRDRDDRGRFMSDDRSSSRSRRDDDDDRSRDHGGWFGDSRGHSEAARRGWEGRH